MSTNLSQAGATIVAVGSPPGCSPRGIVRVSGAGTWPVVASVLAEPFVPPPFRLEDVNLHVPSVGVHVPAMLSWMPGPRTYTGEDMAEIHTIGAPVLLSTLCEALVKMGARLAAPGEFTRRAFLNGRMDLARAEGVLQVIHSSSEYEHRRALQSLRGELTKCITRAKERLMETCALIEAAIDFSDQDIEIVDTKWADAAIKEVLGSIRELLSHARDVRVSEESCRVVLVGKPNAGKSSLFNRILRSPRAIVSDVPGTTRDVVEAFMELHGVQFRFCDPAGIRETTGVLESMAVERAYEAASSADLALLVLDGSSPISEADLVLARKVKGRNVIVVINKCDLPVRLGPANLPGEISVFPRVHVSALTGQGIDALELAIAEQAGAATGAAEGVTVQVNTRQRVALAGAAGSLQQARRAIESGLGLECVAADIREAMHELGQVTGEVITEDILDMIFARFCIGK